jgi:hypothetical protein
MDRQRAGFAVAGRRSIAVKRHAQFLRQPRRDHIAVFGRAADPAAQKLGI